MASGREDEWWDLEGDRIAPVERAGQLPEATPEVLARWKAFLQEDARAQGGTASVLLRDGTGGLVKVTCCSRVVITELITHPADVAAELRSFGRETT